VQRIVDGVPQMEFGSTVVMAEEDVPEGDLLVPDFDNIRIADRGGFENLFGKGWQQVPGRPLMDYTVVYWGLLLAQDTRYCGRMTGIDVTSA